MLIHPLDEPTFKQTQDVLNRARANCVSPITALHTSGLLLTGPLASRIRAESITSAAEVIGRSKFVDLIGTRFRSHGATPSEVRTAIVARLELLAELAQKGEFR